MSGTGLTSRVSLRHLIFLLLLISGLIPLAIGSWLLTRQNIEILETQEQAFLTRSAQVLSEDLSEHLATTQRQLAQLGKGLLILPGPDGVPARLQLPEVQGYFASFMLDNQDRVALLSVLDLGGAGPTLGAVDLGSGIRAAFNQTFQAALESEEPVYQFVRGHLANEPLAVVATPVRLAGPEGRVATRLVLVAALRLQILEQVFRREAQGEVSVFLVDSGGRVLWAEGADDQTSRALAESSLVNDFKARPLNLTAEYELFVRGKKQQMLGRVSPVLETGWGIVVQKPLSAAYTAGRQLVSTALVSSLTLVLLSMVVGAVAARRFSRPFQDLAASSHDIALGNFGQRIEVAGPGREIAELAEDFNRMSGHVERQVEQLREAAKANEELFISAIRAFAAAVDAKDPYTRGHSERVADYSRTIAGYLGQSDEFQQRIWISGVLHDVGKIGIEDHILKKGGVLTAEEYEQMKLHPVIGYDILRPIEPLREMLPAIRWHHEAWNGRGYPDGLQGESIPLIARIVAVADTFDAITTNRPYQKAYTPEYAVETITKLTGARFDAKVVTAFLRAFQEGSIVKDELGREAVIA